MDIVQSELADHIGTITLNHKEKLNALSTELVEGIISAPVSYTHLDVYKRQRSHMAWNSPIRVGGMAST